MIIGDGDLREQTEAQVIEFGLSEHVIFTGWIENLTQVYSDLDATVISSLSEGTPVALIEAMASGCPVVSTAVGGVPDLLEHGKLGKLAPTRDADALAQAMIEVIQSPPDSGALRRDIAERYSIQRLVHDLDTLYRQLLNEKRPNRV